MANPTRNKKEKEKRKEEKKNFGDQKPIRSWQIVGILPDFLHEKLEAGSCPHERKKDGDEPFFWSTWMVRYSSIDGSSLLKREKKKGVSGQW